jgi:hypothetical protein
VRTSGHVLGMHRQIRYVRKVECHKPSRQEREERPYLPHRHKKGGDRMRQIGLPRNEALSHLKVREIRGYFENAM